MSTNQSGCACSIMGRHCGRIFFCWICLLSASSGVTATLPDSERACLAKAERHERKGWIYLHVEGTARERGFQHGYVLAKEIAECLRVRRALWEYQSRMEWNWLVDRSAKM